MGGQGNGGLGGVADAQSRAGGNGGEASDLRLGSNAIGSRVIVAGGGGGGGGQASNGGVQAGGGNGGAGGGDAGGNGANAIDAPTLTGGGGQGGQSGGGGARGQDGSFAAGTAGNGTTGQGGSGVSFAVTSNFGGAGGGGGGGGTAGTATCTLNHTGAGGGGAGGTSAALAGISDFASSNGVRSGHGFVRLCIPATAQNLSFGAVPGQTYSAGGTLSINAAASNVGPHSGNPITYASLTPGICTVSGTTVSMVSLGTCTLEARQAGSTVFTSASPVSRNVLIGAAVAMTAPIPALSEWACLRRGC